MNERTNKNFPSSLTSPKGAGRAGTEPKECPSFSGGVLGHGQQGAGAITGSWGRQASRAAGRWGPPDLNPGKKRPRSRSGLGGCPTPTRSTPKARTRSGLEGWLVNYGAEAAGSASFQAEYAKGSHYNPVAASKDVPFCTAPRQPFFGYYDLPVLHTALQCPGL